MGELKQPGEKSKFIRPDREANEAARKARRQMAELLPDSVETLRLLFDADATQMSREEMQLLKMKIDSAKEVIEQNIGRAPSNETLKTQRGSRILNLILPDSGRMKQQAQDIWKTIDRGNTKGTNGRKTSEPYADSVPDLEGQEQDEGDNEVPLQ